MAKFSENNSDIITLPNYKKVFIYFLLNGNEVVYVGQTKQGIARPLSHKDKDFNTIKILYCKEDELDKLEDKYIMKYRPVYNKACNHALRYGLTRAKQIIRKKYNLNAFSIRNLRKIIKQLGIKTEIFNQVETITVFDFLKICEVLENEIHDRGI